MQIESGQNIDPPPTESGQVELPTSPSNTVSMGFAVIVVVFVTLLFIVLGFPLLRDWLLALTSDETRAWLSSNKPKLSAWVDWLRIVFEIALALFISNQVFNEAISDWFKRTLDKLRVNLTSKTEQSIKENDARVKIRNALHDVFAFMYLPGGIRQLPGDMKILYKDSQIIYAQIRYGMLYLFIRLLFLRMLSAFSGKLHATAALIAFWAVLLMKVIKLYLDSPILIKTLPH